ncbi:M16 family metallopeptidase [Sandaracinus amylolyticus]|uniref:M16 family metallopeptidase n=1 Tax=Sandaracinus amylolyticus TaxID=927083 RepID=UPI001F33E17A|nr:pitrilysin family protein [Sandaracinus amylolyticus]UJR79242.1 Putative secreted zinc protease [Sandaracinus amylolyticus]
MRKLTSLAIALSLVACGPSAQTTTPEPGAGGEGAEQAQAETPRVPPPPSGPARDVHLPPIARTTLANGLEVNTVRTNALPLVYVRLVVRSGLASSPEQLPGLSRLVAKMLKEGTRRRTSAQLAEQIEYLGADLFVGDDQAQVVLQVRALSEHLDTVMDLLADIAQNPRFDEQELRRLKAREADRLRVEYADAATLARRAFYQAAYGSHPYANVDLTPQTLERARRTDLANWHRDHFVPNNAFLVVAGDVTPEQVQAAAQRAFGRWRRREVAQAQLPDVPQRTQREVLIVHRPGSAQSVIAVGNLAIARSHPDWVPLEVANQVLGGSAASRLFSDLRERRSLTYGAYSSVDELPIPGPFRARGSVGRDPEHPDVDRTPAAMDAFMEHLQRIVTEAPPQEEVNNAQRYLSDSFPLQIDTAGRIAGMVSDLRLYGLADDYFDTYRSDIRNVTPDQALEAARAHIRPDQALVVIVGDAEVIAQPMRRWGPVRVVDPDGREISSFPAEGATPAE